jgi:coenzyme PQQ biosynthesis protein C
VSLMSEDALEAALRDIGTKRYHHRHPFHALLHGGKCSRGQVQAWALNRYYYQSMIPLKDASLIARCDDPALRREWRSRLVDHDGESAGDGGIARWLKLTDALGLDRDYVVSLAGLLPATRFAVDAYVHFVRERSLLEAVASSLTELFSPEVIEERMEGMLKGYAFVSPESLAYFNKRPLWRGAIHNLRLTISSAKPEQRSSSNPCWAHSNSSAACCGRCWMRSITPM